MNSSFDSLITSIVVILGIITTIVISSPPKTTPKSDTSDQPRFGSQELDIITSEEEDLDKEIADEHTQTCVELLVDCWLYFNRTKPYLKENHRGQICFRRIHGFPVCGAIDQDDVKNAKKLAENHEEDLHDRKAANAERRRRLQDLREEWEEIRDNVVSWMTTTPSEIEYTTESNSSEIEN